MQKKKKKNLGQIYILLGLRSNRIKVQHNDMKVILDGMRPHFMKHTIELEWYVFLQANVKTNKNKQTNKKQTNIVTGLNG